MKTKFEMSKKELMDEINKLHPHRQPRWKNRATKDELLGFLLMAEKIWGVQE